VTILNEQIDSAIENVRKSYRLSILLDNTELESYLLDTLSILNNIKNGSEEMMLEFNNKKKNRYTYNEVRAITNIQLQLSKGEIPLESAEREVQKIVNTFPIHNLSQYNKRVTNLLNGIGEYGLGMPSNWAKALLEETNYDINVINGLKEQQRLYREKDGKANKRIDELLENY